MGEDFCDFLLERELMVGGVGRRESESKSSEWKLGLREMSRPYL